MRKWFIFIGALIFLCWNTGDGLAQTATPAPSIEAFRKLRTTEDKMDFIRLLEHYDRKTFEGIYPLLDKKNDLRPLLLWHFNKSVAAGQYGIQPPEANASMQYMQELAEQNGYEAESLAAQMQLAFINFSKKELSEQQLYSFYLRGLTEMKRIGLDRFHYFAPDWMLYQMGRTFYTLGDEEKALESLILSVKYTDSQLSPYYTLTLNLIQAIYAHQKNYQNAIVYAQKIYDVNYNVNPTQDPKMWRQLFWQGLSSLDIASYYMELNDLSKAEIYANRGYKLSKLDYDYKDPVSHTLTLGEFDALQVIIKLKLKLGKLDEVQQNLDRVEVIRPYIRFDDPGNYFKALPLYHNYTQFYEKKREFARAYTYLKLTKMMEDSLAKQNDKRKLWQIEMRVDAERYQGQIKSVEEDSRQQQLFRNVAILSLIFFLIVAYIIYRKFKRDNQTIARQKKLLEESLSEKETLLREIHHRVKNNLQIISGLFDKQARQTTDELARKLMKEGQDRVYSIALVHQNLYQTENLSSIELKPYLEVLTKNIERSQNTDNKTIDIKLEVDDSVVEIDTAIPLGLIINELVTNCYKYAFQGRSAGQICITFSQKDNQYDLEVRDNGVGIQTDIDVNQTKSLGLNLVRGLVRQLDGHLDFHSNDSGTVFKILLTR
jgi:two-component sensor histidine kinase